MLYPFQRFVINSNNERTLYVFIGRRNASLNLQPDADLRAKKCPTRTMSEGLNAIVMFYHYLMTNILTNYYLQIFYQNFCHWWSSFRAKILACRCAVFSTHNISGSNFSTNKDIYIVVIQNITQ
jgi:hypothetical protein